MTAIAFDFKATDWQKSEGGGMRKGGWNKKVQGMAVPALTVGLTLALALFMTGAARAAGPALDLMQAYEAARKNDPAYKGAVAERDAGREFEAIGRARVLPVINAVSTNNRNNAKVTAAGGNTEDRGQFSSSSTSLQLRQPLYSRDAWASKAQGEARTAASDAAFRSREQQLIVRVFEAYAKAVVAQEQVELVQAQLKALDEQLRANEQRFTKGEGTRTDVLETGSKRALVQARLIEATDADQNARTALEAIIGMPVQRVGRLKVAGRAINADTDALDVWRNRATQSNGEIESLRKAVEVARQELRRVEGGHHPKLDLVMSTGRTQSDTTATFQQTTRNRSVGLELTVPIYAGGSVSAQARQAAAQLSKAEADLEARTGELMVELHRQHTLQRNSTSRIAALQSAVESSSVLIEATRKSVVGGERTNIDVLEAQERLAQAERDLIDARNQQLLAGLRLRSIAGTLQEADLQSVAREFNAGQ